MTFCKEICDKYICYTAPAPTNEVTRSMLGRNLGKVSVYFGLDLLQVYIVVCNKSICKLDDFAVPSPDYLVTKNKLVASLTLV